MRPKQTSLLLSLLAVGLLRRSDLAGVFRNLLLLLPIVPCIIAPILLPRVLRLRRALARTAAGEELSAVDRRRAQELYFTAPRWAAHAAADSRRSSGAHCAADFADRGGSGTE